MDIWFLFNFSRHIWLLEWPWWPFKPNVHILEVLLKLYSLYSLYSLLYLLTSYFKILHKRSFWYLTYHIRKKRKVPVLGSYSLCFGLWNQKSCFVKIKLFVKNLWKSQQMIRKLCPFLIFTKSVPIKAMSIFIKSIIQIITFVFQLKQLSSD